jgi:ferredoxin-NADP reductase
LVTGGLAAAVAQRTLPAAGRSRESSDVVSVYLTSHRLVGPAAAAGRAIHQHPLLEPVANPFSLSVAPNGHTLRITAKALGDGNARPAPAPGTRALFEGPYGRLSSRAHTQPKVLLAGAGVGITREPPGPSSTPTQTTAAYSTSTRSKATQP